MAHAFRESLATTCYHLDGMITSLSHLKCFVSGYISIGYHFISRIISVLFILNGEIELIYSLLTELEKMLLHASSSLSLLIILQNLPMHEESQKPPVPAGAAALAKGLDILNLIGASPYPLKFNQIQNESDLPKPTLARILRALQAYRLINQNKETNRYSLGNRFLEFAHRAWDAFDLRTASFHELERLSSSSQETVAVAHLDGGTVKYLDHRSPGGLTVQIRQDQPSPLHASAAGKALLAFAPLSAQKEAIKVIEFRRFTNRTICDLPAFRSELALTQARGYAISIEEHFEGVSAVAAPITGPRGQLVGALAVLGPSSRLNADIIHSTGRDLIAASRRITGIAGVASLSSRPKPKPANRKGDNVVNLSHSPSQLGEGPIWSVAEQRLYWVDILETVVYRFDPISGINEACPLNKLVCSIILSDGGSLVAATQDGLELFDFEKGELTPLVNPEPSKDANRLNDAKCDSAGRLWVGSMRLDTSQEDGSLYRIESGEKVSRVESGFIAMKGIDWSPDGKTFYFVDTIPGNIYAYDFEPDQGLIYNRRIFAKIPETEGRPDGLAVDSEGYVWCAIWDGWRIDRFHPNGTKESSLELPIPRPTNIAFGGEDLSTLFITSARVRLPKETLDEAPESGDLFSVRPGVKGREPNYFKL